MTVRTHLTRCLVRPSTARERTRVGPDSRWRRDRENSSLAREEPSYWAFTKQPLPSLIFLAPLLATYEFGVLWLGDSQPGVIRTGVDAWVRQGLAVLGLTSVWLPPLLLVLALLTWQVLAWRPWRLRPAYLFGMVFESAGLAVVLVGLSRLVDLGLTQLDEVGPWLSAGPVHKATSAQAMLGYLGAGVYEEAIFRLALVPISYGLLRILMTPKVLAGALAVTGSAWLFSIAHHVGLPGEPFTWYAFFFRWAAGVYFAWVFVARGFGIAVGTHAAYDLLVAWFAF